MTSQITSSHVMATRDTALPGSFKKWLRERLLNGVPNEPWAISPAAQSCRLNRDMIKSLLDDHVRHTSHSNTGLGGHPHCIEGFSQFSSKHHATAERTCDYRTMECAIGEDGAATNRDDRRYAEGDTVQPWTSDLQPSRPHHCSGNRFDSNVAAAAVDIEKLLDWTPTEVHSGCIVLEVRVRVPQFDSSLLATCAHLSPWQQRLLLDWVLHKAEAFAPTQMKSVAACFCAWTLPVLLADLSMIDVTRHSTEVGAVAADSHTDAPPQQHGRSAHRARRVLPSCQNGSSLASCPAMVFEMWLLSLCETLCALRGEPHAAVILTILILHSRELMLSAPAAVMRQLHSLLTSLFPMMTVLCLSAPVQDALLEASEHPSCSPQRQAELAHVANYSGEVAWPELPYAVNIADEAGPLHAVNASLLSDSTFLGVGTLAQGVDATGPSAPTTHAVRACVEILTDSASLQQQCEALTKHLLMTSGSLGHIVGSVTSSHAAWSTEVVLLTVLALGGVDFANTSFSKRCGGEKLPACINSLQMRCLTSALAASVEKLVAMESSAKHISSEVAARTMALQHVLTQAIVQSCSQALQASSTCEQYAVISLFAVASVSHGTCSLSLAIRLILDAFASGSRYGRGLSQLAAALLTDVSDLSMCVQCGQHCAAHRKYAHLNVQLMTHLVQRNIPTTSLAKLCALGESGLLQTALASAAARSQQDKFDTGPESAGKCTPGVMPELLACDIILQNPSTRLAILDALNTMPAASHASAATAFAAVATVHAGRVLPSYGFLLRDRNSFTDPLVVQSALAFLLSRATPARLSHFEPLVASAEALVSQSRIQKDQAAESADTKASSVVAEAMVSALLTRPSCAPLVTDLAASAGTASVSRALQLLLQTAVQGLNVETASIHSQQWAADQESLMYSDMASTAAVSSGISQCVHCLMQQVGQGSKALQLGSDAFANLYLVLLSQSEPQEWRAHSRRLVFQISQVVDSLSKHPVAFSPEATGSHSESRLQAKGHCALEKFRWEPRSCSHNGVVASMRLLMQLLMPVMPIVYYDTSKPASGNLRHTLASTLIKLLHHSNQLLPMGAQGTPDTDTQLDWVLKRAVLLLHALLCEEWARWIVCHETRGIPQSPGIMVDQSAVYSLVKDLPSTVIARVAK